MIVRHDVPKQFQQYSQRLFSYIISVAVAIELGAFLARHDKVVGGKGKSYPQPFMNGGLENTEPEITGFHEKAEAEWRAWDTMQRALPKGVKPSIPSPLLEFPISGTEEYFKGTHDPEADRVVFMMQPEGTALFCGLMTHNFQAMGLTRKKKGLFTLCKCE